MTLPISRNSAILPLPAGIRFRTITRKQNLRLRSPVPRTSAFLSFRFRPAYVSFTVNSEYASKIPNPEPGLPHRAPFFPLPAGIRIIPSHMKARSPGFQHRAPFFLSASGLHTFHYERKIPNPKTRFRSPGSGTGGDSFFLIPAVLPFIT